MKKCGFENEVIQDKAKNSIQQKYNVSAISKVPEVKQKIIQSTINHYGVPYPMQNKELKKKALNTRRKQYNLKDIALKGSITYYNKTGYYYPSQNPAVKEDIKYKLKLKRKATNIKIKNTVKEKYNRNYIGQLKLSNYAYNILKDKQSFINYIDSLNNNEKDIYKIANKLNIHYQTIISYLRKYDIIDKVKGYGSSFEKEVKQYLDNLNIEYKQRDRSIISPYELDFYIPKYKLAIECNGTYYHSFIVNNDKKYHYNKSRLCEEKGVRLIHI